MSEYFDYIPRPDQDYDSWQKNMVEKANTYMSTWGLPVGAAAEWTLLTTTPDKKKMEWDAAWAKVETGEFEHKDVQRKNDARKSYESGDTNNPADTSIRLYYSRYMRFNPLVTNTQRADMGLPIHDATKSPAPGVDGANVIPEVAGVIKTMGHLIHHSAITTPGVESKSMGTGVEAIEIHVAFTAATVNETPSPAEFHLDGEAKRGVYTRQFEEAKGGMKAWYKARKRFRGKTKTYGPFSPPWSGLIS